ncbi:hypothetical protein QN219_14260 [Sinorhizobium sp. 7-81]|uniref:hypothetical protein n=1 Tax=Sinorhizobium sp. 8-89 TaxID=3049089 RepID=UPI0024C3C0A5|nr:hypothetical protein [Sinorhizobium sp. 8-89]MDK1491217.1 hypothetical protein [Sinorhizobium sp. 8-89]
MLVDTYDTTVSVRVLFDFGRKMKSAFTVQATRPDSGDLLKLSRQSRRILDEDGPRHVKIFASGGPDEWIIDRLVRAGAPCDLHARTFSLAGCAP